MAPLCVPPTSGLLKGSIPRKSLRQSGRSEIVREGYLSYLIPIMVPAMARPGQAGEMGYPDPAHLTCTGERRQQPDGLARAQLLVFPANLGTWNNIGLL